MAKKSFSENLRNLFGMHQQPDESFFEDLEDTLVEGDLGARTAYAIVEELRTVCRSHNLSGRDQITAALTDLLSPWAQEYHFEIPDGKVSLIMVFGVNGVGKTTTVAKMASHFISKGVSPIVLAAADTFRAAAIEQLQHHGDKTGCRVIAHQHGADPSAVVYSAVDAVRSAGGGLVIADTAGRLHNKENLVRELQKIDRTGSGRADIGCYKKILVLDATTGLNGLRQAEVFHEHIGIDALVLTKYDSTARGGTILSAGKELSIPVAFIGTGEMYQDLETFDAKRYIREFLGDTSR
jgi:fused signal recognition particle receptor